MQAIGLPHAELYQNMMSIDTIIQHFYFDGF